MTNSDALAGLTRWYAAECNGDWEHTFGIKIETLDNPGWSLQIDLIDTDLESTAFATVEHDMASEVSWWRCWRDERAFYAACGAPDLGTVIAIFLQWAATPSTKAIP